MLCKIIKTSEYGNWLKEEAFKSIFQIEKRLALIEEHYHFGDHKKLTGLIWELRWKNGRRLYYAYLEDQKIILLLGGNKNGQSKDIKEAIKILKKYQAS